MVKLLHTSDVHLGAKFLMLGRNAEAHRNDLKKTFSSIVTRLIEDDARFLLIGGDLFDSNAASQEHITFVVRELKRIRGDKYAIIIPGSHDSLTRDSVYFKKEFSEINPNIILFTNPELHLKVFPEFDITFWARPNTSNRSSKSPLDIDWTQRKKETTYNVVLAHGSVQIEGKSASDDLPIHFSDIESSRASYIALGHWHGVQDFSRGGVTCWYSGSPEITYQEGKGGSGSGYILEVGLEAGRTTVNPVKISQRDFDERIIDLGDIEEEETLHDKVLQDAHENLIRVIHLVGLSVPHILVDEEQLEAAYADNFFSLKIKNESHLRLDVSREKVYPPEFVSGQFFKILEERLATAKNDEEKKIIEEALQLGLAELEGKRII